MSRSIFLLFLLFLKICQSASAWGYRQARRLGGGYSLGQSQANGKGASWVSRPRVGFHETLQTTPGGGSGYYFFSNFRYFLNYR